MNQQDHNTERGGLKFDPTINAGHVLTFIALLSAMFAGWTALDKRVLVLEEQRKAQEARDLSQDARSQDKFVEIRDTLADIRRSVEVVRDKVEKRP